MQIFKVPPVFMAQQLLGVTPSKFQKVF